MRVTHSTRFCPARKAHRHMSSPTPTSRSRERGGEVAAVVELKEHADKGDNHGEMLVKEEKDAVEEHQKKDHQGDGLHHPLAQGAQSGAGGGKRGGHGGALLLFFV